jgi:exodeoxyribonuclease VII large subunit
LHRFGAVSPVKQVQKHDLELKLNTDMIFKSLDKLISFKKSALHEQTLKLEGLNPLAILGRGYSITRTLPDKRVITDPGQVELHENVEVLLAGGVLLCDIKGKSTHGEKNV